ncbi:MAG TPA: hypothetical protein VIL66_04475 [Bacillota bacterium]
MIIKKFLFCLFLLVLLSCAGCEEDKEGLLDQYAGGRLGVILETSESVPTSSLCATIVDYISKRVDLQVVNPELLLDTPDHTNSFNGSIEELYRAELGLDLLLKVKLSNLLVKKDFPSFKFKRDYMEIKTTYTCSLTLSYLLHDLHSGKILNLDQSKGKSEKTIKLQAGKGKIKIDNMGAELEGADRIELLERAIRDALRNTDLI